MKTTFKLLAIAATLWACSISAFAVVDQTIQVQGTNLVLSWPSTTGSEQYLIQYRPTLSASTPWQQLTNAYPANSTNRTTFVVPCCALVTLGAGVNMESFSNDGEATAAVASARLADSEIVDPFAGLWAMPIDGTGDAAPLSIYPPGFDTNMLVIFEMPQSEIQLQNMAVSDVGIDSSESESGDPAPMGISNGGCDCPSMGFFRVFHIPNWSFNVTNYTYDGPTFFPVDFADYMDRVENIEVLLNGQPLADAAVFMPYVFSTGETNWGMGIYFDLFPSGTYQLQLLTTLRLNEVVGDEMVSLVLSNQVRSIVVDNEVTFPDWDDLIQSTNFTFHAQTKRSDTDWWIDIYDAWENYVNGGYGHTSNGQIQWTWDLTDTAGNPRDNLDSDPFFYSYITFATAGAGPQTMRSTPAVQTAYPNVGYWLFTYLDRHYLEAGTNYPGVQDIMTNAITNLKGGPIYRGIPASVFPVKFGTNTYTQQQRNDSYADLKARLFTPQNRNFYYYGHANGDYLGCDIHTFDTNGLISGGKFLPDSKAYVYSLSVSNDLTFNRYAGSRPYRFVWLDGCSSANGNWPGAFGVDKACYDISHYTNSASNPKHRRPSAFVGWNQIVGGPGWGSAQSFFNYRTEWMFKWYYGWQTETLWNAYVDAIQTANWPPGREGQLYGALRVYGYTNLLMNAYNQKNDWRWP